MTQRLLYHTHPDTEHSWVSRGKTHKENNMCGYDILDLLYTLHHTYNKTVKNKTQVLKLLHFI